MEVGLSGCHEGQTVVRGGVSLKVVWLGEGCGASCIGAFPPQGAGRFSPLRCGTGRVSTAKKWA